MRSKTSIISLCLFLILIMGAALNIKVTTKQGVNFKVSTIELPLYLKVLNFYDRHFNYKWLAKRIIGNLETKEDRIFRLFQWTYDTIKPQPKSLPIMDDHVWNVYVRGYGVSDNFHFLFATLCNYVGAEGVYLRLRDKDSGGELDMSFVRLARGWVAFDPFNGVYFINKTGGWATINEIKNNNWRLEKIGSAEISDSYYKPFLGSLPNVENIGLESSRIQSPLNRIKYQTSKFVADVKSFIE